MSGGGAVPAKFLYRVVDERAGELSKALPLLSVSISRGVVRRNEITDKEARADDLRNYKVCAQQDVVINRMSAYQGALGISPTNGLVSPDYLVLKPNSNVDPRFLAYTFRSTLFIGEMTARLRGIGSTEQGNVRTPRINEDDLGRIPILVPARDRQRDVADYLDRETARIDALIAAKRRLVELLEERFSTWRDVRMVAQSSSNVSLGRFVASIGQGVSPEAEDRTAEPNEWAVLKLSAVKSGRYSPIEHKALPSTILPRPDLVPRVGDLLVTRSNTPLLVGDACAVTVSAPKVMLCDLIYVLRLRQGLDPQYAAQALLTRRARLQLASAARGTSQSMVKLRGEDIRAVVIPVPDLDEQRVIVTDLNAERQRVERMTSLLSDQIGLLQERRQALITAAVTGQLDIPEAA